MPPKRRKSTSEVIEEHNSPKRSQRQNKTPKRSCCDENSNRDNGENSNKNLSSKHVKSAQTNNICLNKQSNELQTDCNDKRKNLNRNSKNKKSDLGNTKKVTIASVKNITTMESNRNDAEQSTKSRSDEEEDFVYEANDEDIECFSNVFTGGGETSDEGALESEMKNASFSDETGHLSSYDRELSSDTDQLAKLEQLKKRAKITNE